MYQGAHDALLFYPHGNPIRLYYYHHHHHCHPYVVAQRRSVSYLSDMRKVRIMTCLIREETETL